MRLLLVEDEEDLAASLRLGLMRAGYAVDVVGGVRDAGERIAVNAYDILLLDVNLPDGDGFALCRAVRSHEMPSAGETEPRILMLTARGRLEDRIRGLDDGADDYLVKPFAVPEMLARVRALLRREVRAGGSVLRAGALQFDPAQPAATWGGQPLQLSRKEFGVLEYLLTRSGQVVSAEELLEHVWDENADPFTSTVRVTVGTLRRKLAAAGAVPAIETVIGRGYRLAGG